MDEILFLKLGDDIETSGRSAEEEKDFLESLVKKAAEIESEPDNSN